VAVVCAGVKSILDIGLTLEYLETHGVPVVSVGQAASRLLHARQRLQADFQLDTPEEQARFIRTKWQLGLEGGVVVSNPVPEAERCRTKRSTPSPPRRCAKPMRTRREGQGW
jgi:pseudouridine-5'-phosphate glycosidase